MIYSMTAFAREQSKHDFGILVCEMRSINHRYLEISTHLPEMLRALEMPIRECIREKLKRGKVECSIRYQFNANNNATLAINQALAQELCKKSEAIAKLLTNPAPIVATDILRFPGVLETKEVDVTALETATTALVSATADDLLQARGREGEELKNLFLDRMKSMKVELEKVKERLPKIMLDSREKLLKKFSDAKIELDANRLEQEMVIYAQRIDIAEEVERAETHLQEFRRILSEGGTVGRRLDFLLQELNREANTLGSKSVDPILTHAAVEMKVLIEQIREQVQNIE